MPRIRFASVFHWHVKPNVTIRYKPGREYLVTQRCAAEARAKGIAMPALRDRSAEPIEKQGHEE
jgi:hypothetical protein